MTRINTSYETRDLVPLLRRIVRDFSRKRSACIVICDAVTIGSQQWSGGTRELWTMVDVDWTTDTWSDAPIEDDRSWPKNMGVLENRRKLLLGEIAVQCGTFCGKPSTPFLYMTRETAETIGHEIEGKNDDENI